MPGGSAIDAGSREHSKSLKGNLEKAFLCFLPASAFHPEIYFFWRVLYRYLFRGFNSGGIALGGASGT